MIICNAEAKVKGSFFCGFIQCFLSGSSLMFTLHMHHGHYTPHSRIINAATNEMIQVMNNQCFSLIQTEMREENELNKNTY